jgi:hypothetical protein
MHGLGQSEYAAPSLDRGDYVALFAPASVKALKKEAEFIGPLHGQAFLGRISSADVADVVGHADFRARLRSA